MKNKKRDVLLVVEDDKDIAELERAYLEAAGFLVEWVGDGESAMKLIREKEFALVLLDVMLPGMSGLEVCKRVRAFSDVPIIMVTARSEAEDIVEGLELGSDDYVPKPFDPMVLVARVKAGIERYRRHKNVGEEIVVGKLRILPQSLQVYVNEREVKLTKMEFRLLKYLAEHLNVVVTREDLFEEVWGMNSVTDESTVTVHIKRLRKKLGEGVIETVWGAGYRMRG